MIYGLVRRVAPALVAAATCAFVSSCQSGATTHRVERVRGELPTLALPAEVSGDVEAAVDELCDWALEQQIPFDPASLGAVSIDRLAGPDADATAWRIFFDFARVRKAGPSSLTLVLDPAAIVRPEAEGEAYDLIATRGEWTVEHADVDACSTGSADHVLVEARNAPSCLRISRPPGAYAAPVARATFDAAAFGTPEGPFDERQRITVEAMSFDRADRTIGRSVRLTFSADPWVPRGVNHVCPPILPGNFESIPRSGP